MIHDHAQESNTVYEALEIEKQTLLPARPAGHQERISLRHDFHLAKGAETQRYLGNKAWFIHVFSGI